MPQVKAPVSPSLRHERALAREGDHTIVIGCDEVGRGALAGPVAVGIVAIDPFTTRRAPAGIRDSKLLSEPRREELAPKAAGWAMHSAVGLASADEIDVLGLMHCLGLAARRALLEIVVQGVALDDAVLILDGNHDYISGVAQLPVRVVTRVKADRHCTSVAAASVVAKVHRDRIMIGHDPDYPEYGWASNKGYASRIHLDALDRIGPTALHRRTWLGRLSAATERPDLELFDDLA